MNRDRFDQGMAKLNEVDGGKGQEVIDSLADIAPDIGRFIVEFAFGDIYTRDSLDLKQRELVTIASLLTAGGCEPQLEVHINRALNVRLSEKEIIEAIIQCTPYTGFPKVLNAVGVARKVFAERTCA